MKMIFHSKNEMSEEVQPAVANLDSVPKEKSETVKVKEAVVEDDLSRGILQLLQPAVEQVDERVLNIRKSQVDLREHIDQLTTDLQKLSSLQKPPINLEAYVKKLLNCRRRVVLVNSVLNNAHERLNKLQQNIMKETNKRKAQIE